MTAVPLVSATGVAGVKTRFVPENAGPLARVTTASVPSKDPGVPPASLYKATPDASSVARSKRSDVANPDPEKFTWTEVSVLLAADAVTLTFAMDVAGELA